MVCIGCHWAQWKKKLLLSVNQMEDVSLRHMAGMTFTRESLWNQDAVVVQSGIGKVKWAICTQILVNIYGVDMLINHRC